MSAQWFRLGAIGQNGEIRAEHRPSWKLIQRTDQHSMLRILTYHRVLDSANGAGVNPSLVSAVPRVFDQQMRHLAKNYRVLSLEEVLAAQRGIRPLPKRAALVTFDDAYRDFSEIAWPILRRYRLPAVVFVSTAYPDQPDREFWWDRLFRAFHSSPRVSLQHHTLGRLAFGTYDACHATLRRVQNDLKTLPHAQAMQIIDYLCDELDDGSERTHVSGVLRWDELRELAAEGVTVAAHTQTHPALTQLPLEEVRQEIRGSRRDLQRELGTVPPIFSFPFGLHNDRVIEVVREEGFELAVTCRDGHNKIPATHPLRLRRTNITRRSSSFVFRLRLLRAVSYADRWRHRGAVSA